MGDIAFPLALAMAANVGGEDEVCHVGRRTFTHASITNKVYLYLGIGNPILQTKWGDIMRKSLIALSLGLSAGLCWSTVPAAAADFYILDISRDNNVSLLDPTTIVATQAGHKTFHFAQIDEDELWIDNNTEVDCTGKQMRKLSAISHLAGGDTVKGLSSPGPWGKVKKGSVGLYILDVICQWPNSKPTGNAVYTATDFKSAIIRISHKVSELNNKK